MEDRDEGREKSAALDVLSFEAQHLSVASFGEIQKMAGKNAQFHRHPGASSKNCAPSNPRKNSSSFARRCAWPTK